MGIPSVASSAALLDKALLHRRRGDGKILGNRHLDVVEGADSIELLGRVAELAAKKGFEIVDCDCTVAAQAPKLGPYREQMRENMARVMGVPVDSVGVKATTTERLGFVGRKEGIAAWAVCILRKA